MFTQRQVCTNARPPTNKAAKHASGDKNAATRSSASSSTQAAPEAEADDEAEAGAELTPEADDAFRYGVMIDDPEDPFQLKCSVTCLFV